MKKLFHLFAFCFLLFAFSETFSFTSSDVDNANFLAEQGIITKQTDVTKYRLDDTITRAEVAGIALKLAGVTLPNNYVCKKYFSDVTRNDWICRAVEMAADRGYVSRGNTKFRGQDKITRAEALSMLATAAGIKIYPFAQSPTSHLIIDGKTYRNPLVETGRYAEFKVNNFANWQTNLLLSVPCEIYTNFSCYNSENGLVDAAINSYINTNSSRKEVINYATNILMQLKSNTVGILYFQKINDVNFIVPDNWSIRTFPFFGIEIKPTEIILNHPYDSSPYNLLVQILKSDKNVTEFERPNDNLPYEISVRSKKQISINGLDALEYEIGQMDAVGLSIKREWCIFIGDNKVLRIFGWYKIRDEEDYSSLFPDIEKIVQSVTKL